MTKRRESLSKRASLYPLSFDSNISKISSTRDRQIAHPLADSPRSHSDVSSRSNRIRHDQSYDDRISRLERGMLNMQEQIEFGFKQISRELRSLSSSAAPSQVDYSNEDIQHDRRRVIEDSYDDHQYESESDDRESIEEITREYYPKGEIEKGSVDQEAQKQFIKEHRKEIRNEIKILLKSAKFTRFPIDYNKKFSVIAPELEAELIPRIYEILEQRGFHVTLKTIKEILSGFHKNGRRKLNDQQLNETQRQQKKAMGHVNNRLSEVIFLINILVSKYSRVFFCMYFFLIAETRTKS